MPIPLPNLDDRTFADLVADAQALIPSLQPTWTNHNPTDPGIVVIELLAWLTEMALYQVNEIPAKNIETFLTLLQGKSTTGAEPPADAVANSNVMLLQGKPTTDVEELAYAATAADVTLLQGKATTDAGEPADAAATTDLATSIRTTLLALRQPYRAVTAADFEQLALTQWPPSAQVETLYDAGHVVQLARAHAVPRRNLAATNPGARQADAPGHLSLVVIPATAQPFPQPSNELCEKLGEFLAERRLLTMRHHVVGPTYVPVQVAVKLQMRADATPRAVLNATYCALNAFFAPLTGGPTSSGWPFGRDVYVSEIYAELEKVALVDYVVAVTLATPTDADEGSNRLQIEPSTTDATTEPSIVAITLDAHELVEIQVTDLIAYDRGGIAYEFNAVGMIEQRRHG